MPYISQFRIPNSDFNLFHIPTSDFNSLYPMPFA